MADTDSRLFTPFKTKRAFEEISDQIRQLIYAGVFKPGDKLPSERELSHQFRAGRMVVREALRTLEHSGLIYIKQGSLGGAFIKDADATVVTRSISDMIKIGSINMEHLTEVRLKIEEAVLEMAIERINVEDLDQLRKNIEEANEKISKGIRPTNENINFHMILAKASKNPLFEIMVESIMEVMRSFLILMNPGGKYIKRVSDYHEEIYRAVKERNLKKAQEKMEEHLLDVNRKLSGLSKNQNNQKRRRKK
jgi:DNA-binding FadR family transcriptional regulator